MTDLKRKLRGNRFVIGSWITLADTAIAEIMSDAGYDWLAVDMEHSAITLADTQELVRVIELSGVAALVRVGENNAALIKRVMDTGAHGVIVPMVNTRDDALKAVRAVKYPPEGTRGVGLARAQGYGMGFQKYRSWAAANSIVIAQIEHIDAIDNLEDILSVEGVDGSMIGPYDLSGSLGHPGDFERKDVKNALLRYEKVCRKMKKPMGFHAVNPDIELAMQYKKKGYSFLAVGLDTLYLAWKCREVISGVAG